MLKLKNVSKFYYSKGVIASGFSRVNLELDIGEFVVITGESGSGKSTLLNVLSGLDTYEEGEMYINGQETSHYNEADFEEYRRKYVGNIFQNFNLVNSYTVYQNVELALLLNGEKRKDVKEEVKNIIDKVGLTDFINTKCSKLSGGQKQRVAIARALAKETPIIVADEPTGNLDSESAADVIKLLSEISKDKLVIIVTHNIEQVEHYATRLIKMHDGKILEDKKVAEPEVPDVQSERKFADITLANRFSLGMRNAFNIPVKFILIFVVFLFIALAVGTTYSSFQKEEFDQESFGWNEFFNNRADNRIVINKPDRSPITPEELAELENLDNVKYIAKDDMLVDYTNSISDADYWYNFYGNYDDIKHFDGEPAIGRMPEAPNEILVEGNKHDYYLSNNPEELLEKDFYIERYNQNGERQLGDSLKIVGIVYSDDTSNWWNKFYVSEEVLETLRIAASEQGSSIRTLFEGQYYYSSGDSSYFYVEPNENVPQGKAYVSSELNAMTEYGNCVGKELEISIENIYHQESMKVKIEKTYTKSNFEKLTGIKYADYYNGYVFVNPQDYDELVNNGIFQSSVFVKDAKQLDATIQALRDKGFNTLAMRYALNTDGATLKQAMSLLKTFVLTVLIIALFFISYFIIKIVLKSRNAYYTTIRTLGASRKISKQLLDIELFIVSTLAYIVFMGLIGLVHTGVITQAYIVDLVSYLTTGNFALMYLIMIGMSYMISHRFAKSLFRNSVMSTYREEV